MSASPDRGCKPDRKTLHGGDVDARPGAILRGRVSRVERCVPLERWPGRDAVYYTFYSVGPLAARPRWPSDCGSVRSAQDESDVAAPLSYRERLARKMPRVSKFLRQGTRVVAGGRRPATRVVFVVGSQRSGTRLPLQILDGAPEVMTYSEGTAPYFDRVLLKPLPEIERLLTRSLFPGVALKPICQTHRINELLDHFPDARGIWIFRDYRDATNSASAKWKSGKEAVRRLAAGELDAAGWRAGGLTTEKLQLVRRLYSDSMSLHAANAVMCFSGTTCSSISERSNGPTWCSSGTKIW